jgi:cyclopropane-fatty-acyl-phospholipid synthase
MATDQLTSDPAVRTSRDMMALMVAGYSPCDFAVRFWDGSRLEPEPGQEALFTLALNHPGALKKMLWPPDGVAFAEAYVYGDFDIEGDIFAFFRFTQFLIHKKPGLRDLVKIVWNLLRMPSVKRARTGHQPVKLQGRKHSLERDKQAVGYHYDLSNEFFGLWLDKELLYTCAYFANAEESIDTAQARKLDYVCRKLRLQPGERLLDIGCGWGSLVMHAARHYGVEALGVTLSRRQAELAGDRIKEAGLEGRCRVEYRDYREISDERGFDKMASIGMLEHLGESMMRTYFREAYRLLKPGGVFLNHAITLKANTPFPRWTNFARKYVFPDGELRPLTVTIREAENAGFEVRDVESLREHYALTLERWVRRLEECHEEVKRVTDETTFRVFRLYLAGARMGFVNGVYNLHQELLGKPDNGKSGLPLTRADWYTSDDKVTR